MGSLRRWAAVIEHFGSAHAQGIAAGEAAALPPEMLADACLAAQALAERLGESGPAEAPANVLAGEGAA